MYVSVCLCFLLIKILRYLQTGIVIAALSRSHHCDVLVRLGCFGRGSADCPFSGQRTWDTSSIAGLYYLTNLTAPIAGYLVGNHSDRTGERLILFRLCALAGFAGWAAIALSTKVWMPFLISSLVLAFSVAASSQLFAAVRDDLDQEAQGSSEGVVAIVRMALTAGWVIGPMVGAWLAAATSLRAMLWMTPPWLFARSPTSKK